MATKDWKKISKDFWQNTKDKESLYSTLKIEQGTVPTSAFGSAWRKEYKISLGKVYANGDFIENHAQWYKTKPKAVRYAKAYMRSH